MKNKFCPRWDSNPRPPAFAASVLSLNHEGLTVENEQHTEANMKYFESISLQRHPPENFWHREETPEDFWN